MDKRYELSGPVETIETTPGVNVTYCKCCELPDAIFGPQKSFNGLPMAQIVCDLCARHQRSMLVDVQKKERDHREMWMESNRYDLEVMADKHAEEVEELQASIAALQKLDERPVQVVETNLDAGVVSKAHEDARKAYRSRDHAYLQMTKVHMLHFEVKAGLCRCGIPIEECEIAMIFEGFRGLLAWERNQWERRRRHQNHMLPDGHPGITDARWDPDEDEVAEFDPYPHREWDASA